jgi:hypothetical protein
MAIGVPEWTTLQASSEYVQAATGKILRILNVVGSDEQNQKYIIRGDLNSPHKDSQLCAQDGGASYYNGVAFGKSSTGEQGYGMPPLYVDDTTVFMLRGASASGDNVTTVYYTVVSES